MSMLNSWKLLLCALGLILGSCGGSTPDGEADSRAPVDVVAAGDSSANCGTEGCDDENLCTDDLCLADGTCQHIALPGQSCDDGNACTDGDTCSALGLCVGTNAIACDDTDPCTMDACNPDLGCEFKALPDGTACEDGTLCTASDSCDQGVCVGGEVVKCEDADDTDCAFKMCNPSTGQCDKTELLVPGSPCKDGNPCTDSDTCTDTGQCKGGEAHKCVAQHPCKKSWCNEQANEGENPCVQEWKDDGVGCDDGDKCTGQDACAWNEDTEQMKCSGEPLNCDDGNPCTSDACNEELGCSSEALVDGTPCLGISDMCSTGGKCDAGECVGAVGNKCADNNPCTDDLCDPETGDCTFEDNTASCDDGDLCTSDDACKSGACVGSLVDCTEVSGLCLQPLCNPLSGQCDLPLVDGTSCNDEDLCNGVEVCAAGQCIGGTAVSCDDDENPCTDDVCNPLDGSCGVVVGNGAPCGGEDPCAGGAACQDGICQPGAPVVCEDDGNDCTQDVCNALDGKCGIPAENGASCGDINGWTCLASICQCEQVCDGKECGDDGCGGTCGTCDAGFACGPLGQCTCEPDCNGKDCGNNDCDGSCGECSGQDACVGGQCECQPDCAGKECGDDGCGGFCGSCEGPQDECLANQCVCQSDCSEKECGDDGCGIECSACQGEQEECVAHKCVCQPMCDDKDCGEDGCGGDCGSCQGPQDECIENKCACQPDCNGKECGDDGCGVECYACLGPQEDCVAHKCVCQPACDDKECGIDGCGGVCGECGGDGVCIALQTCAGVHLWSSSFASSKAQDQFVEAVDFDSNGNLYISGTYSTSANSTPPDFGVKLLPAGGEINDSSGFLVKTDAEGSPIWARLLGSWDNDRVTGLSACPDGDVIISGHFRGPSFVFGGEPIANTHWDDAFVVRYSSDGEPLWARVWGGGSQDGNMRDDTVEAISCGETGVAAAGFFNSEFIEIGGKKHINASKGCTGTDQCSDTFLVMLSHSGEVIWSTSFGIGTRELPTSVALAPDGRVLLAGWWSDGSNPMMIGEQEVLPVGGGDAIVAAFNSVGDCDFAWSLGGPKDDWGRYVRFSQSSSDFVLGASIQSGFTVGDLGPLESYKRDGLVLSLDDEQSVEWSGQIAGKGGEELGGEETLGGMDIDSDGAVYVVARTDGEYLNVGEYSFYMGDTIDSPTGGWDSVVAKLGPDGVVLWARQLSGMRAGGLSSLSRDSLAISPDGHMAVGGCFRDETIELGGAPLVNSFPGTVDAVVVVLGQ